MPTHTRRVAFTFSIIDVRSLSLIKFMVSVRAVVAPSFLRHGRSHDLHVSMYANWR